MKLLLAVFVPLVAASLPRPPTTCTAWSAPYGAAFPQYLG